MNKKENLIPSEHIGDGFYMGDSGYCVDIAVNHHENIVGAIDIDDIDKAIKYLTKVKNRIENE